MICTSLSSTDPQQSYCHHGVDFLHHAATDSMVYIHSLLHIEPWKSYGSTLWSRSFKVIEIGINQKPVCDFLLMFCCFGRLHFRPLSRAAATFSGWREPNPAGAPTKIRLAAAGDVSGGGGIRRNLVNGGTSHYQ